MSFSAQKNFRSATRREYLAREYPIFIVKKRFNCSPRQPRVGQANRFDRLGFIDSYRNDLSRENAKTSNWGRAALSSLARRTCIDGDSWMQLSGCRGFDLFLRASTLPLRFDGLRNRARSCDHLRIHPDAWTGGNGVDQQSDPSACCKIRALQSEDNDERYHGPRGENSISHRSWLDEPLHGDRQSNGWENATANLTP